MGVVRSRGEEGAELEATSKTLRDMTGEDANDVKRSALQELCSGVDVQLHASSGRDRLALYSAWLVNSGASALVVVDTAESAAAIRDFMSEHGVAASICETADEVRASKPSEGCVIATIAAATPAYKGGKGPASVRCIVDSVDSIVSSATLLELEAFLVGFREVAPEGQLVLISNEPSLNTSALSRRFLTEPKTCSIKASLVKDMEHVYYEVGTSLLAKPQALCDLLELEGGSSAIVFCNSPSDADFADVILKKRGVSSIKLIGYVPQIKLSKAVQQLQKKEVSVLVLTDVAARGVPLEEFDVVVNYSVPTDPEVYFHRYGAGPESLTKKVISLVAALDIANFHYLKKLGKLEFIKGEIPTPEQLFVTKFAQLRTQALEKGLLNDSTLSTLVEKVMSDDSVKAIVALLLHNTITVLPSLKAATTSREESAEGGYEEEEDDGDEDRRPQGGDRRGRGGRGGQQNNRNQRGGGRRSHGRYDDEDSGEGQPSNYGDDDEAQPRRGQRRGERDRDRDRDRDRGGEGRGERPPRRPVVIDKEARLYVGAGSRQGISPDSLTEAVVSACGVESGSVHRVSVRECYSFVDVPEAIAEDVVSKLSEAETPKGGNRYFVKRAVTLSIPREGAVEESAPVEGSGDMDHSNGSDDSEPTMLAVDDAV